jgi:4-hydroxyphenylpyruvate dioxygenase
MPGPLSLEIFNDQFRAGLPRLVAQDGHRSLMNLMDRVRRAEPACRGPARLSAAAPVHGVEFIEFATSQAEAPGAGPACWPRGVRSGGARMCRSP